MNIGEVNWRNDAITRAFIATHKELSNPRRMPDFDLAVASTYCLTFENPYSEEICRRAGMANEYAKATTLEERTGVIAKAAFKLSMRMGRRSENED